eukprot:1887977-Prorocentrum_lima.AAC.1
MCIRDRGNTGPACARGWKLLQEAAGGMVADGWFHIAFLGWHENGGQGAGDHDWYGCWWQLVPSTA